MQMVFNTSCNRNCIFIAASYAASLRRQRGKQRQCNGQKFLTDLSNTMSGNFPASYQNFESLIVHVLMHQLRKQLLGVIIKDMSRRS